MTNIVNKNTKSANISNKMDKSEYQFNKLFI